MRAERLLAWGLFSALAVVTIVFIFWTPYDSLKLFRPIPSDAAFISSHHRFGARVTGLATNIFIKTLFNYDDLSAMELFRRSSRAVRVAAGQTLLAYAPDFNRSSKPALVITSWIGGWAPVFRWALWFHRPTGVAPVGEYNGRRLWVYKQPIIMAGPPGFLSFAFEEGVFIACLSAEPNGIAHLLRNYDGQGDSVVNAPQWRFMEKSLGADKVWLRFPWPAGGGVETVLADCAADVCDPNYFAASVRFEPDIIPAACLDVGHQHLPEIGKLFACSPAIVALIPSEVICGALNAWLSLSGGKDWNAVLAPSAGKDRICLLMVFTGPYGGRYGREPLRIAVPAVLLAASDCRSDQSLTGIAGLLDMINAKYRTGLILNSAVLPVGQRQIFSLESTAGTSLLGSLPVEDQPAFCFYKNWLLLSSNNSSLRKIITDIESPAASGAAGGIWLNNPAIGKKGSFVVCEPKSGGRVLRLAITGTVFMLERERRRSNENAVKVLKAVRSWLENMDRIETCRVWFEPEGGRAVMRIEVGRN